MSTNFTIENLKQSSCAGRNQNLFLNKKVKRSKYGSVIIEFDGKKFRSVKERNYYVKLRMLERSGEISNLRLQVPYELNPGGSHSLKYLADFVYQENGKEIVVDVKGFRTNVYKKKKALMLKVHGIEIKEV